MTTDEKIVIIGGGVAGFRVAESLTQGKYVGTITVVDADPIFACNRPLLSKAYLEGTASRDELSLPSRRRSQYIVEHSRVRSIDVASRTVHTLQGAHEYSSLVMATGLRPQALASDGSLAQVTLTTWESVESLRLHASAGARVAVVGGGTLGLEAASSLRSLGADVTLVSRSERPLERVVGRHMSVHVAERIRHDGIRWIVADGAQIRDGALHVGAHELDVELVVAAIGSSPDLGLFPPHLGATSGGVNVDSEFRALADPSIFVVGDAAIWDDKRSHPHWFSAMESARRAAKGLLGTTKPGGEGAFIHSFWSDQWGARLQAFGTVGRGSETVLRGDEGEFIVGFSDETETLTGVIASSPRGRPSPALTMRGRIGAPLAELRAELLGELLGEVLDTVSG